MPHPSGASNLERRKVLLCVGPGGVGKTSCAASLALAAADRGLKVVVVTLDPSRRLAEALGLARDGGEMRTGEVVPVGGPHEAGGGKLHALVLETERVFDDIVRTCAASEKEAATVLENRIYRTTVSRLGGALEYAAMAQVQMLHARREYDLVVLDTPPTANAIDFLEAPGRVREVVSNPAAKILTGTGRLGMRVLGLGGGVLMKTLQSLGGGPFLTELGGFLRDFGEVLQEFQRRAGDFEALLTSPDTGVVLVTSAAAFSIREASDFLDGLDARGMRIDAVTLNRVDQAVPPLPARAVLDAALEPQLQGEGGSQTIDKVVEAYRAARLQGDRGEAARKALASRYPTIPIHVIVREDPPPTSLDALLDLGRRLLMPPPD